MNESSICGRLRQVSYEFIQLDARLPRISTSLHLDVTPLPHRLQRRPREDLVTHMPAMAYTPPVSHDNAIRPNSLADEKGTSSSALIPSSGINHTSAPRIRRLTIDGSQTARLLTHIRETRRCARASAIMRSAPERTASCSSGGLPRFLPRQPLKPGHGSPDPWWRGHP
jgi:hypothetical protein